MVFPISSLIYLLNCTVKLLVTIIQTLKGLEPKIHFGLMIHVDKKSKFSMNVKESIKKLLLMKIAIVFLTQGLNTITLNAHVGVIIIIKRKHTLARLSKTNPRNFWKYIKKYKKQTSSKSSDVTVEDFITHFQNVSSTPHPSNFNPQDYEPREESVNID